MSIDLAREFLCEKGAVIESTGRGWQVNIPVFGMLNFDDEGMVAFARSSGWEVEDSSDSVFELSPEQKETIEAILKSQGFFFVTGKAGTGKSTVCRELMKRTKCIVLAPTGLAAVNVNGQTIHSFFGFPVGPLTDKRINSLNDEKRKVLEKAETVVLDEISMVRADLLDAVDKCMRKTLGNDNPFGGKRVVAFGDIWQLEPVTASDAERKMILDRYQSPFFFDCETIRLYGFNAKELSTVFRQKGDDEYIGALNAIRKGDKSAVDFFNCRVHSILENQTPVHLTFTNRKAQATNKLQLSKLGGEEQQYDAIIEGEYAASDMPTDPHLRLKPDAQVMFVKNIRDEDGNLVANGSVGRVLELGDKPYIELQDGRCLEVGPEEWSRIEYEYDPEEKEIMATEKARFVQLPIKLAWAITVHKSQGQTLDAAVLELERNAFGHGQTYVALSRVKGRLGLSLNRSISPKDVIVHPRVVEFDSEHFGGSD